MEETRRRITEAAVALHGRVGPARTTVSAVAERAGVQRHTVYRHFPTEAALFEACSTHFFAANPWPDPEPWRAISDPHRRVARALDELYAYYERTAPMFSNVFRDLDLVDALRPTIVPLQAFWPRPPRSAGRVGRPRPTTRRMLAAAVAHGVDFRTWRSLTASREITGPKRWISVIALVEAAAAPRRRAAA